MSTTRPAACVVIPTCNRAAYLRLTLEGFLRQTSGDFEAHRTGFFSLARVARLENSACQGLDVDAAQVKVMVAPQQTLDAVPALGQNVVVGLDPRRPVASFLEGLTFGLSREAYAPLGTTTTRPRRPSACTTGRETC